MILRFNSLCLPRSTRNMVQPQKATTNKNEPADCKISYLFILCSSYGDADSSNRTIAQAWPSIPVGTTPSTIQPSGGPFGLTGRARSAPYRGALHSLWPLFSLLLGSHFSCGKRGPAQTRTETSQSAKQKGDILSRNRRGGTPGKSKGTHSRSLKLPTDYTGLPPDIRTLASETEPVS